jgi:DnaK suppressor protein
MSHVHSDRARAVARCVELRAMLEARRRDLLGAVPGKVRDAGAVATGATTDVLDDAECSQLDSQEGIEFALIELKAETLIKITAALAHLEAGSYGRCRECGDEIAETRLRALPFAGRCKDCEEYREVAGLRERAQPRRGQALLGFPM